MRNQSNPDIKIFLIGNKSDLDHKRKINVKQSEKFKNDNKLDYFIETSAKTGQNTKTVKIIKYYNIDF